MLDLFSRRIVGWTTGSRIDRQLVNESLRMAMLQQGCPRDVLIHSDQGSQYCSADFRALTLTYGATQSMSRRGNCWDNAVAESFFHTLKHILFMERTIEQETNSNTYYLSTLKCITTECDATQPMAGLVPFNMNKIIMLL
ncbi:Integrase core domain [Oligella urethralis]|nr:Integrase core domain [Oligella urethralis]SUA94405.1 Integrase core domain [Oligella urethralis]